MSITNSLKMTDQDIVANQTRRPLKTRKHINRQKIKRLRKDPVIGQITSRSLLHNGSSDTQRLASWPGDTQTPLSYNKHQFFTMRPPSGSSVCADDPCGPEVACLPRENNFICICSEGTEIRPGEQCPMAKRVNLTPPAILLPQTRETTHPLSHGLLLSTIGTMCLLVILLLSLVCWRRNSIRKIRNKKNNNDVKLPDNMTKLGTLHSQSYASNPNYCSANPSDIIPLNTMTVKLIPPEQIHFLESVGEGCFGKVYRGEYTPSNHEMGDGLKKIDDDKQIVAVKVLKELVGAEAHHDFLREVEIVSSFKHPNILSLIGVVAADIEQTPWMVFEFMPYGDLAEVLRDFDRKHYVNDRNPKITKDDLLKISIHIASGMEYLASQHFVHRDLACRNCLVGANFTVKISDFGMSRDVYTCDYYKTGGSRLLPVRWMAPESILYGKFTLESDVWAFGVVLWEVYSFGKQPYYGNSNEEAVTLILQNILLSPPETCPQGVLQVMKLCWSSEAHNRPTFPEILQHLYKVQQNEPVTIEFPDMTSLLNYSQLYTTYQDSSLDHDEYLIPKVNGASDYLTILSSIPE